MTKFITTADIHIWIRTDVPRAWQVQRYLLLFDTLIEMCRTREAGLIIAGDLFEKAEPDPAEQELALVFFRMLNEAGIETWLVSGNHETVEAGVDTFKFLDTGVGKTVRVNYGKFMSKHYAEEGVSLHFVNHCDLPACPKGYDEPIHLPLDFRELYVNVLISHFRCNVNVFIREEIPVDRLLEPFDLCVAGDIHQAVNFDKLWYANAPVNKVFESAPDCGVILLEIIKGGVRHSRIPLSLPALVKVTLNATDPLPVFNATDFYRVEVSGTIPELRDVNVEALNVKLLKVPAGEEVLADVAEQEAEELKNIPLEQELLEYMQILKYPEEKITRMLGVFSETTI